MFTRIYLVFPFSVSGCSIWRAHANLAALGLSKLHQQLACSLFEKSTWPRMVPPVFGAKDGPWEILVAQVPLL